MIHTKKRFVVFNRFSKKDFDFFLKYPAVLCGLRNGLTEFGFAYYKNHQQMSRIIYPKLYEVPMQLKFLYNLRDSIVIVIYIMSVHVIGLLWDIINALVTFLNMCNSFGLNELIFNSLLWNATNWCELQNPYRKLNYFCVKKI